MFVVGGGNYIEYQNLQDYCQRQQNTKRINYGASELMSPTQFLGQVSGLVTMTTDGFTAVLFLCQLTELGRDGRGD